MILKEFELSLLPLIEAGDNSQDQFYYHGDTSPKNTFFPSDGDPEAILLDLEQAGATNNRVLAMVTDFGDYYNRSWSNKSMQQEFIKTIFEGLEKENNDFAYQVTKAAVIAGTIHGSFLYVDETHKMHSKAANLINNLEENLVFLDTIYSEGRQVGKSQLL